VCARAFFARRHSLPLAKLSFSYDRGTRKGQEREMNIPGFNAEASLYKGGSYRHRGQLASSRGGSIIPAIPRCENCDWILENCERNGWRPRALCAACAVGNCYEEPPMPEPFPPFPRF
jgi:hypothetical protein